MISKIYKNLNSNEKKGFIFLIFFNSLLFFFEFVSLASIPIFVASILDPELLLKKLNIFLNYFNFQLGISIEEIKLISGIFIVSIFFLKNIFFILITIFQANYFKNYKLLLSKKIYELYMLMPYEFFI